MELLLDTCTLLYACFDDQMLPKNIKEMIANSDNDIFVSMASLWEIAIKNAKRPESMPYSAEEICDALSNADYSILPIHYSHFFLLKDIIHEQIHQDIDLSQRNLGQGYIHIGHRPVIHRGNTRV